MRQRRLFLTLGGAAAAGAVAVSLLTSADHREAPLIQEDGIADIADVYAFPSPNDPTKIVLAMTVNPFSERDENQSYHFSPNVRYSFYVDHDGDAIEDEYAHFTFSDRVPTGGLQDLFADVSGMSNPPYVGKVTAPSFEPVPNPPIVNQGPKGMQFFAGQRDDPFFFDLVGFNRTLAGTGTFSGDDNFDGFNVSAIVMEAPLDWATGGTGGPIQIWAETARRKYTVQRASSGQLVKVAGDWEQIERMGNPAVATALIPLNLKDAYNIGEPRNDAADYTATIVASLTALGTNAANQGILASVAIPDTIKYDPAAPIAYPNGRALADDVIDGLFFYIFNQSGVTDLVGANDRPFQSAFPYLADPHQPH